MKKINKTYIAGALTHANGSQREIYQNIAKLCLEIFDGSEAYVPHLHGTDPIQHPGVTAKEVWEIDFAAVSSSDLIIAFVGEPSLGTGGELEIARMCSKDVILWNFKEQRVSRMALGNPAVTARIEADDEQDLLQKIKTELSNYNN